MHLQWRPMEQATSWNMKLIFLGVIMLIFLYKKCIVESHAVRSGFVSQCALCRLIFKFEYVSIFIFKDILIYIYKINSVCWVATWYPMYNLENQLRATVLKNYLVAFSISRKHSVTEHLQA